jgi:transposase
MCHPGETGANNVGTAIVNAALHRNGAVEVQARFRTACFACH